jgi:hypothetical protein
MATEHYKTGKKAGVVTYEAGGQLIAREYNPHPANPRTLKQIQQRAKIKLLSQMGALMRFYIAIFPTDGRSARAQFSSINWKKISAQDETAQINYTQIEISASTFPLPTIDRSVTLIEDHWRKRIYVTEEPAEEIKRVFYFIFRKDLNGSLVLADYYLSERRSTPANPGYFNWAGATFEIDDSGHSLYDYVVYAVAMCDKSEEATEYFLNLDVDYIEQVGRLISEKLITAADYYFTETRCISWDRGD